MSTAGIHKGKAINAWNFLQKVHQVIDREIQKQFYDKGVTAAQFEVLVELKKNKKLPMWKISELLAVTGGNVTGLIDRLEKKGLVYRERGEKDRRIIRACITELGERMYENVIGDFEQTLLDILSAVDDTELNEFNHLLEKIFNGLLDKYELKYGESSMDKKQ